MPCESINKPTRPQLDTQSQLLIFRIRNGVFIGTAAFLLDRSVAWESKGGVAQKGGAAMYERIMVPLDGPMQRKRFFPMQRNSNQFNSELALSALSEPNLSSLIISSAPI